MTRYLNLELRKECSRTLGMELGLYTSGCSRGAAVEWMQSGAAVEADVIGEQQLKRTQSGSSSRRGRNRGAVEADAIG